MFETLFNILLSSLGIVAVRCRSPRTIPEPLRQPRFSSRDLVSLRSRAFGYRQANRHHHGEAIGLSTIEAAANRWAREQHQRQRMHSLQWSRKLFVQTATDWLHFLGRLEVPNPRSRLLRTGLPILPLIS